MSREENEIVNLCFQCSKKSKYNNYVVYFIKYFQSNLIFQKLAVFCQRAGPEIESYSKM